MVLGVLLAAGCSPGTNAVVESVRQVVRPAPAQAAAALDPKFSYLRVTRGRHVGHLWRGSTEPAPDGTIDVYYSGNGEVVRILNGRIVGALGLETEWRKVSLEAPSWRAAAQASSGTTFERTRDVMPGYRAGVRDILTLRAIPPPARSALHLVDPTTLTWFEEHSRPLQAPSRFPSHDPRRPSLSARYAVDFSTTPEQVVYSEQCLSPDLCFTWQRWSAAMQQASTAR